MNLERLTAQLVEDEAFRSKPYRCSAGKLTIGIGRNIEDRGISRAEAEFLLKGDIEAAKLDCIALFPTFPTLDSVRQEVLVNMAFNLGRDRLAGFKMLRKALDLADYKEAAKQMLDSLWARQVKGRAGRLAYAMEHGEFA